MLFNRGNELFASDIDLLAQRKRAVFSHTLKRFRSGIAAKRRNRQPMPTTIRFHMRQAPPITEGEPLSRHE
jgi:hypothetical protein